MPLVRAGGLFRDFSVVPIVRALVQFCITAGAFHPVLVFVIRPHGEIVSQNSSVPAAAGHAGGLCRAGGRPAIVRRQHRAVGKIHGGCFGSTAMPVRRCALQIIAVAERRRAIVMTANPICSPVAAGYSACIVAVIDVAEVKLACDAARSRSGVVLLDVAQLDRTNIITIIDAVALWTGAVSDDAADKSAAGDRTGVIAAENGHGSAARINRALDPSGDPACMFSDYRTQITAVFDDAAVGHADNTAHTVVLRCTGYRPGHRQIPERCGFCITEQPGILQAAAIDE